MQVSCSWRCAGGGTEDVSAVLHLRDDAAQHGALPPRDELLTLEPDDAGGPCELTGALAAACVTLTPCARCVLTPWRRSGATARDGAAPHRGAQQRAHS